MMNRNPFTVSAIGNIEPKYLVLTEDAGMQTSNLPLGSSSKSLDSSSEESSDLDEREKLRRSRISKSNKGNVPWNKGRKHSAGLPLAKLSPLTRICPFLMQKQFSEYESGLDWPCRILRRCHVRMKLLDLGHAQRYCIVHFLSDEIKIKIGLGVKRVWECRRGRLMFKEKCHLEWKNLIAEASRKGYSGDEELQWDSFEILDKQLENKWFEISGREKSKTIPPDGRKAPKSLKHRRKIAEAISAKWADT
ncbi:hypothetical protein ACLOJK_025110 [Asimina triloba]